MQRSPRTEFNRMLLSQTLRRITTVVLLLAFAPVVSAQRDIRSVVVEDTLIANPRTPMAMLRAVRDLINVGEYELARDFLQRTIDEKLGKKELLELHRAMGSAFFLRIQRTHQLAPAGNTLTQLVTKATDQTARDPKVIGKLIASAKSKDDDVRRSARSELLQIGEKVVPQLIDAINNEKQREENKWLFHALANMGEAAVPPLIGALASDDPGIIHQSLSALRFIPSSASLPFLFRSYFDPTALIQNEARLAMEAYGSGGVPSRAEATAILRARINTLLVDPEVVPEDLDGMANVWWWNSKDKQLASRRIPRDDKALLHATWLARDLYRIDPTDPRHREYYLLTQFGWNKTKYGLDKTLPQSFLSQLSIGQAVMAPELDQVLSRAIELELTPSVLGTAEALGRINAGICVGGCGDRIRTLTDALRHPEHRVRFAAAKAILRLDPRQPFHGASDLMDVVAQTISAQGKRKVLIIHNRTDQADQMLGSLNGLGFDAEIATNGKQAFRMARRDPDIELILLSETVAHPRWSELLQQLQHDYHTKGIPLCLIARSERLGLAEEIAIGLDGVESFPIPHDEKTMASLMRQVLPLTSRFAPTSDDRILMANMALELLRPIATKRATYSFYELLPYESQFIESLNVSQLSANSARILGGLGTPAAQSALLDMAGQSFRDVNLRKVAATEFDRSIQQSGIMLKHSELLAQYEQYNQVLERDEDSAEVLSSILDSIEKFSRQE